ncbi:hemerythrin domain-containing protein [Azospirillum sp. TSO35-2]|uniref:hemerythrin domain-containing protein n=1 Tax=Azospirillum sp. TSO35-2 TaxID=716796 RepID=UPI000D613DA7|nr:hemerythrin domain-containing protein [Azospirillum sp. TSO35-2]PWC35899.1 hypothetical protein TSO352_11800 [Azospirillum sp. TSO35-2]
MHTDSLTGRILHDDHHRVLDLLDRLEAFLGRHAGDAVPPPLAASPDRALVATLADELDGGLDGHFAAEEALFPALAAAGGHELTAALLTDHAHILPLARRLGRLCRLALREGFDSETWPVFHSFGGELVDALVAHIETEETTLLPATDALLSPADDAAFAGAMAGAAAPPH